MAGGARKANIPDASVQMHRLSLSAHIVSQLIDVTKHGITMAAVVGSVWVCKTGLVEIVGNDQAKISALAKVVNAFQLDKWMGTLVGGAGGAAALVQRKGKQRAVKKVNELRKQLEAQDPYNAGSGLTETGATPK